MVTRSVRTDIPGRSTPCVDEPASRNSIHAPRGSPVMHLEDQAPLLRGCPDRGGERPAKGGAHALHSNVWGDARRARRVPRQIKKKGCLSAALFLYLAERGGLSGASMHPPLPRYALQGQPTAVRFCSCRTVEPRRGFSSPRIRGVDHYNNRLHPPNVGQEKSRPVGGFFLCLAERGGFEPPRRYKRLPDFESGTFNHSATSPGGPRRTGDAHHTRKRGRRQVIPVNEVKIS